MKPEELLPPEFRSANEYHAKIVKVLQEYGNVNELFGHVKIITFNHDELLEAGLNLLAVLGNDVTIQAQPAHPVK
ncbi:MAG: hypothetical protein CL536_03395, partial [Alcaligenaceae bacterium]|nr:hypothetical protein [Alcaligenaceae bacterium]